MGQTADATRWVSALPFEKERIGAVAIYCSDGRYNEQFDEFLHGQIGLPRYDRLVVPGGPGVLAGHFVAYREEEAIVEALRFLIESHKLERVVLIQHAGCGFYLKKLGVRESELRARQIEDVAKAVERVRGISSRVLVDGYLASVVEGKVGIEGIG